MGIPLTPRSPKPRIREPEIEYLSERKRPKRCFLTIGYDTNAGFIDMRPVAQDVVNLALVFNRYELEDVGEKETGQ
jgi:hypothetical protein